VEVVEDELLAAGADVGVGGHARTLRWPDQGVD
jgi:hypothetical protein